MNEELEQTNFERPLTPDDLVEHEAPQTPEPVDPSETEV